ncbi:MAG: hypothetical protein DRP74_06375 [Candidatus Omnitrophota bacterium]|nr:MAG: hypothetical protein DRP74_06375 [Candidatus Omnitrophota bacterium]
MLTDFREKVERIVESDPRYKTDAYIFVMQALWYTQKRFKRQGHVNGRELLKGIRAFGLEQYGPMTKTVFNHWGIKSTEDFGEIVFNMVDSGLLHKTEEDSRQDFRDGFDFDSALNAFDKIGDVSL